MSVWREEEVKYLQTLENSCIELSREYHVIYFKRKTSQNKFKIPTIIIGSFTGVASFGSSTFPPSFQKWISVCVGLINVAIAILSTLESFLKLGEELNASKSASEQLKKLAEDINRELALEMSTRQTSGVIFLRDSYTRYQQILSTAPVLSKYVSYLVEPEEEKQSLTQKVRAVLSRQKTLRMTTARNSVDIENTEQHNISPNRFRHKNFSLHNIHNHLNVIEMTTNSAGNSPENSPGKLLSSPEPITKEQKNKQQETLDKIVIEDDGSQSTVSNTSNDTRLQKLKQLIRPNNLQ
jgi:hypothetical protein